MATTQAGSAKRFGVRYGRRNREKVGQIEAQYRGRTKSPFCGKNTVKRIAPGIFTCTKTGKIFTGRAYNAQPTEVK